MYGILQDDNIIARFVAPMRVTSNVPVFSSDSMSLRRSISRRSAQRWEITTHLEPLTVSANDLYVLFITNGLFSAFEIIVPQNTGVISKRERYSSNFLCNGTVDGTTVDIDNFGGYIPKGTMLRFSGHSKIYMAVTDRQGNGLMEVYPALRMSLIDDLMFWQDDVRMPVYLDTEVVSGMSYTDGQLMDYGEISLVEAL